MATFLDVVGFIAFVVHVASSTCVAITNVRYCLWDQIYTYYPEVEMADWVSVDSPALCGSCPPGRFYAPSCGAPNQDRWDGCGACWPGTFSVGGDRPSCIPCGAGKYAADFEFTACVPCPAGTFSAESGASSCESCPTGTFYNLTGADSPSLCRVRRSFAETTAWHSGIGSLWK